ncbi:MAG: NADH-quinone oxidoreductase subunit L, partial [Bacteroidetes bacterium]|nr:NADH-quinone oxidoreductase subunit L [Bacteroidota bacterium]
IDEIYLFITKKIIFYCIGKPAQWFDKNIVDGTMNGIASGTAYVSNLIKPIQSGKLQDYSLYFFTGLIGFVLLFIYLWK